MGALQTAIDNCNHTRLHNNIVFSIEWLDESTFLTGSADKSICEWVVGPFGAFLKKSTYMSHSSGVKSLSRCPEKVNCFVSGGRDGNIYIWDKRCHGGNAQWNAHLNVF